MTNALKQVKVFKVQSFHSLYVNISSCYKLSYTDEEAFESGR